ncbi:MAG: OsmC family protein [Terriglobales bacterium]
MQRNAGAIWKGSLKQGSGTVSTGSGVLSNLPYSFGTRFGHERGTNPEELIAAAHAGCFSMALSAQLDGKGFKSESIHTSAALTLEQQSGNWIINAIHLTVRARVPGIDPKVFADAAQTAERECPVSRVLNAKITMDATLESESQAAD